MSISNFLYKFFILSLFIIGCKSKDTDEQRYTWVTDDPLTIPYKTRLQRLEKGNLVRNSSFETGKVYRIDSNTVSFSIDGWQQIGDDVEWVDINAIKYKKNEVYSGKRSVKVTRKKAFEIDEKGQGIQSDYIKVIPGNYNLSVYLRLENILPQKARLGNRMYDGINISLFFFDRNKNILNGNYNFPLPDQIINTSFKALSFSNFNKIDKFGWGKIIGKSHNFPFPEGNIPSEAHFVKIFIGLKGTGTLWVDSVNFNYSDQNFTLKEKMLKYTDTTYQLKETIIPCPKKIKAFESIVYFHPEDNIDNKPLIIISDLKDQHEKLMAGLIKSQIDLYLTKFNKNNKGITEIPVLSDISEEQMKSSRLVISIGKTGIYEKYFQKLPFDEIKNHKQGYFIFTPTDQPNLIIIGANDNIGIYYALNTLLQMFDDKAPVFHNARISDYPDFNKRFFTLNEDTDKSILNIQTENIKELIKYKYNGAFILKGMHNNDQVPLILQSEIEEDSFDLINLEGYSTPADSLLYYKYPVFINDVIKSDSKYVLPPVFNNQMLANLVQTENCLNFSSDLKYVYTGSSFFSTMTDDADIEGFYELIGQLPVFMDNSMLISTKWAHYGGNDKYYPGRIRLFNLFEPYSNTSIKNHFSKLDNDLLIINLPPNSEIDLIRLATAADFLWNYRTYSKDLSLWKVLVSRYGLGTAKILINYNDKYSMLLEIILKLQLQIQSAKNIKAGQQVLSELTTISAEISQKLDSHNKLVKELQQINENLRNEFNKKSIILPLKN